MADPIKEEINDLILANVAYAKIAEAYPGLNGQNIRNHWQKHLSQELKVEVHKQVEAEAIKRRDSIVELNKLFDDIDVLIKKAKQGLDPLDDDFPKRINALRGLINSKKAMIDLNSKLLGDDQMHRDSMDIVAAIKQGRKELNKPENQAVLIAEERK